jgi:RecA/RadA recombinase
MAELVKRGTKASELLPTGSTLLNLACADSPFGGFSMGSIVNLVSDSDVGKSILAMTTLADIASKPAYDHYRLIYIPVEPLNFNINKLFGKKLLNRLEQHPFETIEEFYVNLMKWCSERRSFICVLDSYDALSVKEETDKAEAASKRKKGPTKDDGVGYEQAKKTKLLKAVLRQADSDLKKSKSLLIVISQVIQNMDPGMFKPKFIITGGQALKHWPLHRVMLKPLKPIKVRERRIGAYVEAEVFKNHLTGKRREVVFPIFYDYGVDDLSSCVNFLVDEKHWKNYNCTELNFNCSTTQEVVEHIEKNNLHQKLFITVAKVWNEIEEELKLHRKPRF